MAFQKKAKTVIVDKRDRKFDYLVKREAKVQALKNENTPEARKSLKKMNDVVYRTGRSNLQDWYAPKKKATASGKQTNRK